MLDPGLTTVVVNPAAAGGRVGRRWDELAPQLRDRLGDVTFAITAAEGHATELAREAVLGGTTTVLSLGGDGTNNEVVNGIIAAAPEPGAVAFGVLPAGTGGDFARILEGDRDTLRTAEAIARSTPVPLDVGRATIRSVDPPLVRYFVNVATFGIGGLIDTLVNESSKALGGRISFFVGTVRGLLRYRPATVRLWVDDREIGPVTINTVAMGNARFCGGGMMIAPEADPSDGLFDVVIIEQRGVLEMLSLSRAIYSGRHVDRSFVQTMRAKKVVAELVGDHAAYLDLDGEAPGVVPATFEIVPGALTLLGARR